MKALVGRLLAAQQALSVRPVNDILTQLDRVAKRWLDRNDPIRREAEERLAEGTGFAPIALRHGLDDMIVRMRGIGALLDEDLGSREALDRFVWRAGSSVRSRAWGPGLMVAIFAGNVPGIPAFDMALSLALKSACLARPATGEPVFAALFARSVAEVDGQLGQCLAITHWPHDATEPYERAGGVVAYGSDESVAAIRSRVPAGVRFVGHGHKLSFAVVAKEAADAETARALAMDVAMFDQQGCVSPHLVYVERGGTLSPGEFAEACAKALDALHAQMPRGPLTLQEAAAFRAVRDEAEFTADAVLASSGDLAWAVIHREAPAFEPSPLNRLLRTYAVDDLLESPSVVAPVAQWLQTIAFAGPDDRKLALAERLGALGASRICRIGHAQQPGPLWRHDGRPTAADLVRWTDVEG